MKRRATLNRDLQDYRFAITDDMMLHLNSRLDTLKGKKLKDFIQFLGYSDYVYKTHQYYYRLLHGKTELTGMVCLKLLVDCDVLPKNIHDYLYEDVYLANNSNSLGIRGIKYAKNLLQKELEEYYAQHGYPSEEKIV